jgi:CubicO group peptidase (beta-lactamase class C family)
MKTCLALLMIFSLAASALPPQRPAAAQAPSGFEAAFLRHLAAQSIPGAVVMVQQGEEILYLGGLGDLATDFDPATARPLGRAVEPFLASLTLQYAEAGRLDPLQSLTAYLPDFRLEGRPNATQATSIEALMEHKAGFGRLDRAPLDPLPPASFQALETEFFPGARFSDCSRCVGLWVHLLESLGGGELAALLQTQVFYPLQMDQTYLEAGQLYTPPADLARFLSVHLQAGRWGAVQLLKPESVGLMARAHLPTQLNPREHYGYGWFVYLENGLAVIDPIAEDRILVARDLGAHQVQISLIPAYNLAAVIWTAAPTPGLDALMQVIWQYFAAYTPPSLATQARPATLAGRFRAQEGPFTGELGLAVSADGAGLELSYQGETAAAEWIAPGQLAFRIGGEEWRLSFLEPGRARSALLSQDWATGVYVRIE